MDPRFGDQRWDSGNLEGGSLSQLICLGKDMVVCQNLVPLVNIKIAGKWMFIPLKMVSIGIDPYPYGGNVEGILDFPRVSASGLRGSPKKTSQKSR
jgi:hypothetical protein